MRQHHDNAIADEKGPITMQSLRRLKARKREIALHARAITATQEKSPAPATASSKSLGVQLKAQQLDISQLRKEREELTNRLKTIEATVQQVHGQADVPKEIQTLWTRVDSIEAFSLGTELPSLRTEIEEPKPSLNSLANLPNLEQQVLQLKPLLDRVRNLETSLGCRISTLEKQAEQLNSLSARVNELAEAPSKCADEVQTTLSKKITALQNDFLHLKRDKELHMIEITKLQNCMNAQPKAVPEQRIKELVLQEVATKSDAAKKFIRNEYKVAEQELTQRITSTQQSLSKLQTQVSMFQIFKETYEKQNITAQFTDLQNKILDADSNNTKTYAKIERLQDRYERFKNNEYSDFKEQTKDDIRDLQRTYDDLYKDLYKKLSKELSDDLYKDIKKDIKEKLFEDVYTDLYNDLLKKLQEKVLDTTAFRTQIEEATKKLTRNVDHLLKDTDIFDSVSNLSRRVDELESKEDAVEKIAQKPKFVKVGTRVPPSSPSSNDNSATDNFPNIPNQRMTRLEADLNELRQAVSEVKDLAGKVRAMDGRLGNVEVASEGLSRLEEQVAEHASLGPTLTELYDRLSNSIQALQRTQSTRTAIVQASVSGETAPDDLQGLNTSFNSLADVVEKLDDALATAERNISNHTAAIQVLENKVPELFKNQFDPFKTEFEERLGALNGKLEQYQLTIAGMSKEVLELHAKYHQATTGHAQQALLDSISTDMAALRTDLVAVQSTLGTKANTEALNTQLNAFSFALDNLESRYENITTEELHQRMVQWFVQTYPSASSISNMSRDVPQMLQDINQLKQSYGQISWIQSHMSNVQELCRNAIQIQQLVKDMPQLQQIVRYSSQLQELVHSPRESPEILAKIEQAYSGVQTAMIKADRAVGRMNEQAEKLTAIDNCVSGLENSIRVLNFSSSSFVKNAALTDLTHRLQSGLEKVREELIASIEESHTKSDNGTWGLRTSSDDRVEELRTHFNRLIEESRTICDGKISEFQSTINAKIDKVEESRKNSDGKTQALETRLDNEVKEFGASINADMKDLLTRIGADKKESLAKIDDNKMELIVKIGNDKKELLTKLGLDKKELLTRIDLDRGTRIKAEDVLRRSINEVKHDVDKKIPHIRELLDTLRREFDSTNTRFIEPNEAYLGSLGSLFVIVFQLQTLFESLNQSDRSSPLEFKWFCNVKDSLERHLNGEGSKKPSSA